MKQSNANNDPQKCPRCGARSYVYGLNKKYNGLLHYRKCPECGWAFKTIETRIQEENRHEHV